MATIWMHDASLYANVRLCLIYFKGGKINFYIKKIPTIPLQGQQKMYEISSFHGPP